MNREIHVRICEGLGAQSPGLLDPTLFQLKYRLAGKNEAPAFLGRAGASGRGKLYFVADRSEKRRVTMK